MPSRGAAPDALNDRLAAARADPALLLTEEALLNAAALATYRAHPAAQRPSGCSRAEMPPGRLVSC
jgi:hypothetical protein